MSSPGASLLSSPADLGGARPLAGPVRGAATPDPKYAAPATDAQLDRTAEALRARGFEVVVAASAIEARREALARIPTGSEVFDGQSRTLEATGILAALAADPQITLLKARARTMDRNTQAAEIRRLTQSPDVAIGSVHAVTESGEVVVASATGNQLGPYAYGAGRVLWVVGAQKIVPTLSDAFDRIERYAFPLEDGRARAAYGRGSMINRILVVRGDHPVGRTTVVLVRESLGF